MVAGVSEAGVVWEGRCGRRGEVCKTVGRCLSHGQVWQVWVDRAGEAAKLATTVFKRSVVLPGEGCCSHICD